MTAHDYGVKLIKDSINPVGDRLTTFEATYPRFVHAELMTHRMFSRNSASSRAIPTKKLTERIRETPVMPKWWGKNQKGMAAREELEGQQLSTVKDVWLMARDRALEAAEELRDLGLHKQIANRIVEPWMFITVIVTATEYDNWFYLRDSEFAQPEIAWVAREMRKLYDANEPDKLTVGEWHLPYVELVDKDHPLYVDTEELNSVCRGDQRSQVFFRGDHFFDVFLRKISTARCARVSYLTHDGVRDYVKDIELHDQLSTNGHWSCFEHPAQAMETSDRSGNFIGWRQYRKLFENEHHGRKLA